LSGDNIAYPRGVYHPAANQNFSLLSDPYREGPWSNKKFERFNLKLGYYPPKHSSLELHLNSVGIGKAENGNSPKRVSRHSPPTSENGTFVIDSPDVPRPDSEGVCVG